MPRKINKSLSLSRRSSNGSFGKLWTNLQRIVQPSVNVTPRTLIQDFLDADGSVHSASEYMSTKPRSTTLPASTERPSSNAEDPAKTDGSAVEESSFVLTRYPAGRRVLKKPLRLPTSSDVLAFQAGVEANLAARDFLSESEPDVSRRSGSGQDHDASHAEESSFVLPRYPAGRRILKKRLRVPTSADVLAFEAGAEAILAEKAFLSGSDSESDVKFSADSGRDGDSSHAIDSTFILPRYPSGRRILKNKIRRPDSADVLAFEAGVEGNLKEKDFLPASDTESDDSTKPDNSFPTRPLLSSTFIKPRTPGLLSTDMTFIANSSSDSSADEVNFSRKSSDFTNRKDGSSLGKSSSKKINKRTSPRNVSHSLSPAKKSQHLSPSRKPKLSVTTHISPQSNQMPSKSTEQLYKGTIPDIPTSSTRNSRLYTSVHKSPTRSSRKHRTSAIPDASRLSVSKYDNVSEDSRESQVQTSGKSSRHSASASTETPSKKTSNQSFSAVPEVPSPVGRSLQHITTPSETPTRRSSRHSALASPESSFGRQHPKQSISFAPETPSSINKSQRRIPLPSETCTRRSPRRSPSASSEVSLKYSVSVTPETPLPADKSQRRIPLPSETATKRSPRLSTPASPVGSFRQRSRQSIPVALETPSSANKSLHQISSPPETSTRRSSRHSTLASPEASLGRQRSGHSISVASETPSSANKSLRRISSPPETSTRRSSRHSALASPEASLGRQRSGQSISVTSETSSSANKSLRRISSPPETSTRRSSRHSALASPEASLGRQRSGQSISVASETPSSANKSLRRISSPPETSTRRSSRHSALASPEASLGRQRSGQSISVASETPSSANKTERRFPSPSETVTRRSLRLSTSASPEASIRRQRSRQSISVVPRAQSPANDSQSSTLKNSPRKSPRPSTSTTVETPSKRSSKKSFSAKKSRLSVNSRLLESFQDKVTSYLDSSLSKSELPEVQASPTKISRHSISVSQNEERSKKKSGTPKSVGKEISALGETSKSAKKPGKALGGRQSYIVRSPSKSGRLGLTTAKPIQDHGNDADDTSSSDSTEGQTAANSDSRKRAGSDRESENDLRPKKRQSGVLPKRKTKGKKPRKKGLAEGDYLPLSYNKTHCEHFLRKRASKEVVAVVHERVNEFFTMIFNELDEMLKKKPKEEKYIRQSELMNMILQKGIFESKLEFESCARKWLSWTDQDLVVPIARATMFVKHPKPSD